MWRSQFRSLQVSNDSNNSRICIVPYAKLHGCCCRPSPLMSYRIIWVCRRSSGRCFSFSLSGLLHVALHSGLVARDWGVIQSSSTDWLMSQCVMLFCRPSSSPCPGTVEQCIASDCCSAWYLLLNLLL